jgi:hypothetical protein
MITELVLDVFFLCMSGIAALFPDGGSAPGWLDDGAAMIADLVGYGSGLGAWIPWQFAGVVLLAALACMIVGFGIKIVRIAASFATFGGGSAA